MLESKTLWHERCSLETTLITQELTLMLHYANAQSALRKIHLPRYVEWDMKWELTLFSMNNKNITAIRGNVTKTTMPLFIFSLFEMGLTRSHLY